MGNHNDTFVSNAILEIMHDHLKRSLASLGNLFHLDGSLIAGDPDAPQTKMSQHDAGDLGHSSVVHKVVIRRKGKNQLVVFHIFVNLGFHLCKGKSLADQCVQPIDDHIETGAGSSRIQDLNIAVRIILQDHLFRCAGAVVTP